jgi:hypothetical protein
MDTIGADPDVDLARIKILSGNKFRPDADYRGQKNRQISAKWMRGGSQICVRALIDRRRTADAAGTFLGIFPDKGRKCLQATIKF